MPAYRGINANYETYDEKRAMTEKKRFNAWEHYRKVRTDLYGAGWEDVDEAANHEHIEALEATVDAALNCAMSAIVAPTPATEASSTPRTDAEWLPDESPIDFGDGWVPAEFSRQLERELAEKQKTIDGWVAANAPGGWIDYLRTKRSALANSVCNEMDGRGEGDEGPVVTDDVRAALLFALWHHQGGSSRIGQPLRLMLGVGSAEPLRADQIAEAKRVESALAPSATQDRNAIIEECAKVAENCRFTDIAANRIRALKAAPQGFPPASQSPVSAGDAGLSPAGAAPTVKECLPVAEAVLPQDVEDAISGCVSYYGDKYGIGLPLQNDLRSLADLTMRWANGTRGTKNAD